VRQEVQVLRWVLANQLTEELTIINRRRGDNQVGFVMLHSFFFRPDALPDAQPTSAKALKAILPNQFAIS